jgi:hypothetical protein
MWETISKFGYIGHKNSYPSPATIPTENRCQFRFHANLQEFKPRAQTKIQQINEVGFEQSKSSINSDTNSTSLLQFLYWYIYIYIYCCTNTLLH